MILVTQIAWISFWAAAVINGVGHFLRYRHWSPPDWSTDIAPWGSSSAGSKPRRDVLAKYARSLWQTYSEEIGKLRRSAPGDAQALETVKPLLDRDEKILGETERRRLAEALPKSRALQTVYAMRRDLAALWGRSLASREQLVEQLQNWCQRAEASGIRSLAEFSQRLRSYG